MTVRDGEEISQTWHPAFVFFAFAVAFVSAYTAVHLLDHDLWRTELEKEHAIIRHPQTIASVILGFGTVWCMHFVGMAAVTLDNTPICYDWPITLGSLGAAALFMFAGIRVASNDIFATPDRVKVLKDILIKKREVTHCKNSKKAMRQIFSVTCLERLHFLFFGSFLAASGAMVMHYTGMVALEGPFRKKWNIVFISVSAVYAIVICFVGFWIIFRLRWKVKELWLRYTSAAVIAAAVCGLHFFGMLGVAYISDDTLIGTCQSTVETSQKSPNAWTTHQVIVVGIGIVVPSVAVFIENIINQELLLAHGSHKDQEFAKLLKRLEASDFRSTEHLRSIQRTSSFGMSYRAPGPRYSIDENENEDGAMSGADEDMLAADLMNRLGKNQAGQENALKDTNGAGEMFNGTDIESPESTCDELK